MQILVEEKFCGEIKFVLRYFRVCRKRLTRDINFETVWKSWFETLNPDNTKGMHRKKRSKESNTFHLLLEGNE